MSYHTIGVEVSDQGVMTVTLDRPEVLNAFNDEMRSEFTRLWSQVRSDDNVCAQELATAIAGQPSAAVQGTVKALWQSLDVSRAQSLATALMYTQVGNPLGAAEVDRATAKRAQQWRR